jgi:mannose-6-phosphate isomerase-like protein (cupin superfamily)
MDDPSRGAGVVDVNAPRGESAVFSLLRYAGVGPGDRVALIVDAASPVEASLLTALGDAIAARGGSATRLASPSFDPRTEDVPSALADALAEVDVALDFADHESFVHTDAGRRLVREGTLRFVSVSARTSAEFGAPFASFPLDALFARARASAARLAPGGPATLRTPSGTELSFDVRPGMVIGMPGGASPALMRRGRGDFGLFPAGAVGTSPANARGVIVLDGLVGVRGLFPEPIRLDVDGGFVRRVEGGSDARRFADAIAARPQGGFVGKLIAGLHPNAPLEAGLAELDRRKARLSRREGVVLVGFGDARAIGGDVASTWHADGVVLGPVDWSVDGRPLFRAGRVQGPPESHALAAPDAGAHRPRLVAQAGDLALFTVNARGSMPHVHRNPESDELWVVLEGGDVTADVDGDLRTLSPWQALLVPRGVPHRAHSSTPGASMLVVERLPAVTPERPGAATPVPAAPPRPLDFSALADRYTPPFVGGVRPLVATDAFVVEAFSRPEGMLRPDATTLEPELWIVLRGAIGVEEGDDPPSVTAEAGTALTLPAGLACRVVSTRRDTVVLRVQPT